MTIRLRTVILGSFSSVLLCTGLLLLWGYLQPTRGGLLMPVFAHATLLPSPKKDSPAQSPLIHPDRILVIPKLNQHIPIEAVGLTKSGAMAVPIHDSNAGWFKLGPSPGQIGNAVIDGHNSIRSAGLGVFGRLKELQPGDQIIYQNKTDSFRFIVTRTAQYAFTSVPLPTIYGASNGYHLNLITCTGKWNRLTQSYPDRFVVYTTRIL